jgi:hypothetical protein
MDEDPSNEAFVLSLLDGYDADEAKAMETEEAPHVEDCGPSASPGEGPIRRTREGGGVNWSR